MPVQNECRHSDNWQQVNLDEDDQLSGRLVGNQEWFFRLTVFSSFGSELDNVVHLWSAEVQEVGKFFFLDK